MDCNEESLKIIFVWMKIVVAGAYSPLNLARILIRQHIRSNQSLVCNELHKGVQFRACRYKRINIYRTVSSLSKFATFSSWFARNLMKGNAPLQWMPDFCSMSDNGACHFHFSSTFLIQSICELSAHWWLSPYCFVTAVTAYNIPYGAAF